MFRERGLGVRIYGKIACAVASLFFLGGAWLLHAQRRETGPVDEGFTVTSRVVYTNGAHGPLLADVYIPMKEGVHPGIVFIHGGGWKNGNRHQMIKLIKALAEDGYVCFTIEYDVDPVPFPASFHESLAAVKFFRDHAAQYHLDPARVAVAGSSAGGELAALVALNPSGLPLGTGLAKYEAQAGSASAVQAGVILNGVLDLTDMARTHEAGMITAYLGGTCEAKMDACKDASPVFHVHPGAPPMYVGHGTADQTVPFAEAVAFTNALKAARVPVRFFQAEGGRHTFWADPRFYTENLEAIKEFLSIHLRGGAQAKFAEK